MAKMGKQMMIMLSAPGFWIWRYWLLLAETAGWNNLDVRHSIRMILA
jgi:hypothetical protein